jgi:hypothetical protein
VATLVAELKSSVGGLREASDRPADIGRQTRDTARLVSLLDAIDGPGEYRRLAPISLPETILAAAAALDVAVTVSGQAGRELSVGDEAPGEALEERLERRRGGPVEDRAVDEPAGQPDRRPVVPLQAQFGSFVSGPDLEAADEGGEEVRLLGRLPWPTPPGGR